MTGALVTLSPRDYDAALFDMDGVLTQTATVHAAAWKRLFDEFLAQRQAQTGERQEPFDIEADYRRHVDGKPRRDGVRDFLAARGIVLPEGGPTDEPQAQTVAALARRKDAYFLEELRARGVTPDEGAGELLRGLRELGIKTAVVSSSRNCGIVLEAVGLRGFFDARVDGNDLDAYALKGKPAPDMFLEAARRLAVEPARAFVVEDALAGVAAGRAGGFALVIGVDHGGRSPSLRQAGADAVIARLEQIKIDSEPAAAWSLVYEGFDAAREGMRESLCALGNGYMATRGAACWAAADGVHYPGTYLAGGYNRLTSEILGRAVENESLVNLPNWLFLKLKIGGETWFDQAAVRLLAYRQELDLRRGMLVRELRFEDGQGRRTRLRERRLVSMAEMHVAALELTITAENWSGPLTLRSGIDGRVKNAGARLYRPFANKHLQHLAAGTLAEAPAEALAEAPAAGVYLCMRTSQSQMRLAQAARTLVFADGKPLEALPAVIRERGRIAEELRFELMQQQAVVVEKLATLYTSRDAAICEPLLAAVKAVARAGSFADLMARHVRAMTHLWRRFDVHLKPADSSFKLNAPMLLRLNLLHLLQAASPNSIGWDAGIPARGWTGEAYQGHIFWDELFIFPTLNYRMPEITRSLLMYRYRRLPEARAAAAAAGFQGAMFPWQSGSDGEEETEAMNLNPRSQRWVPDNTHLQRHVGAAIAYNVWQYFQATGDREFLQFYGAPLMLEIARFCASAATFHAGRGRYEIRGVMGPDEFHDAYPGAAQPGLNNNAYTNVMAVWVLLRALELIERLPEMRRSELIAELALGSEERARWEDISRRMFVPFHDDHIISQFEGYDELAELDWEAYRARYGNIQRLELILEAEGDSANRYKVSKQADVLMLFYIFSADELRAIFERLGYALPADAIPRNVDYYARRSSHGSTLSRVVHAWVLARSDRSRAARYFAEALQSDVSDIQHGTTAEGIHLGAMAGTVNLVQRVSTGIEITGDVLRLNPRLPADLARLDMRIRYRGQTLDLALRPDRLLVRARDRRAAPIRLGFGDEVSELTGGESRVFPVGDPAERMLPGEPG